jgi:hypothetical protein
VIGGVSRRSAANGVLLSRDHYEFPRRELH